MEKLKSIDQLKADNHLYIIVGDRLKKYEFLCIHPHDDHYILATEKATMEIKALYIPNLLGGGLFNDKAYVGRWDKKFILREMIERTKERVAFLEGMLEEASKEGGEK